ncbi:MAG: hypothetical protein KDA22_06185 [Phycisphaerales bacterium]|nr:hypothetical protein [Phycisphaerales bacterium]
MLKSTMIVAALCMAAIFGSQALGQCETDLNGDGQTNGADLGILLAGWGECPGDPCEDASSDCCSADGGPGCSCLVCENCVCIVDKSCCETQWDAECVQLATIDCENNCPPCGGALGVPPCPTDLNGDGQTNGADLGILLGAWGACPLGPCESPQSDCCSPNGGPGCSCLVCENCVCIVDKSCCETQWDADCVQLATIDCENNCPCR